MKAAVVIAGVSGVIGALVAGPVLADAPATAQRIPFRQDDSFGDLLLSVGPGLVIALAVAGVALFLLRRYVAVTQAAPGRRLRVVETLRLGPKFTLFLVELDGRGVLIGQQGERFAVLERSAGASLGQPPGALTSPSPSPSPSAPPGQAPSPPPTPPSGGDDAA